jgi:hypothetical protein
MPNFQMGNFFIIIFNKSVPAVPTAILLLNILIISGEDIFTFNFLKNKICYN